MPEEHHEEHHEETTTTEEEPSSERALGRAEAEIEHHEEKLDDHADTLETLERGTEWMQSEISRLEKMIVEIPVGVTRDEVITLLEGLKAELKEAKEEVSSTTSPPSEVASSKTNQNRRTLLHRLL